MSPSKFTGCAKFLSLSSNWACCSGVRLLYVHLRRVCVCNMADLTPTKKLKQLKILKSRPGYFITLRSRVVVQNLTKNGLPILARQIGEVSVFRLDADMHSAF